MTSVTTRHFREALASLPVAVQRQAHEAYHRWRADPSHPGLVYKRIASDGPVFSVRVGIHYRALAIVTPDRALWFWIGPHADYDEIVKRL